MSPSDLAAATAAAATRLADLFRAHGPALVFTGAGMSTRSGIRDYRGPDGVWKTRQPVYIQEFLASAESRVEYWDYKLEGWASFRDARPNAAHLALVDLERMGQLAALVTQNVDGLHVIAGNSEDVVVEIHGTNRYLTCLTCGQREEPGPIYEAFAATREVPVCGCGGWLKPATISFGQALGPATLERAYAAARSARLAISIGSTLVVEPAASVPLIARQAGATYVVANLGETGHDQVCDLRVEADAAELLPAVVDALRTA